MEAPAPFAARTADSGSDLDLRIRIHLRLGSVRIWITLFEPQKPTGTAPARAADELCSALIPAIRVFANLYSAEYSVKDTGIPEMKLGTPNAYVNSRSVTDAICLTQTLNNPYNRGYPYAGRTGDMLHRLARFHPLDFLAAVATYTN